MANEAVAKKESGVFCPGCGQGLLLSRAPGGKCVACGTPLSKNAIETFPWSHYAGPKADAMLAEKLEASKTLHAEAGIPFGD